MKLGIIGLPQAGKTTIYNALTRGDAPTTVSGKMAVHTAVVDVPDPRVDALSALFKPKKTVYAKVTYADIAGLDGSGGDISGALLNELSLMEGFLLVVRAFENGNVAHPAGSVDAGRDIETMTGELLLSDLVRVETKLERLTEEKNKGGRAKTEIEREIALIQKLHDHLSGEQPLRSLALSEEERKALSGYQFLTQKPLLIVLNLGEGQAKLDVSAVAGGSAVVAVQGQIEMEIAQLSGEEAEAFLEEYGIEEPSLNRMIRESYDLLGLQSFFTVGEDEVRAWTVRRGVSAPVAAGTIHSDLQKGFIRAEVVAYDDLIELGSMAKAREAAKLSMEGKEYIVRDGDILHVRFNV
jgi:hypothetical protein